MTDIEQEAEQWFESGIPERYKYDQWKDISAPLMIYQGYIEEGASWINYPEQIVLRAFYPPPELEGFVPDEVNIYYYNSDVVIVTVMILSPSRVSERRFDMVRVDNVWKIVWVGERSINVQ